MLYEHRTNQLLSRADFAIRIARHLVVAFIVVALALGVGVVGYHYLGELPWVDALLNASMILGGMGPVDPLTSPAAKIFASCYALFSGLAFIGVASVMLAPFVHRLVHELHLERR